MPLATINHSYFPAPPDSPCSPRAWAEAEQPEPPVLPVVPELPEVPMEMPPEAELLSLEAVYR